jgi:hypothetical protein
MTKRTRILVGLTGPAALAAVVAMTATSSPAGASAGVVWHQRPGAAARATTGATAVSPTFVSDQFQANTGGFCANPSDPPCDGNAAAGDFGTIDAAIPAGFSNGGFGNYAPGTPALLPTFKKMALISGTTQANQGLGCQTPGVEGCTGPYYRAEPNQNTFPSSGFTVTNDVYLDPAAAPGTAGEIDLDVALNDSSGNFAQDNIFAVCNQGSGSGYSVTFGHNSPGDCSGSPVITTAGWYRFVWLFTNVGGKVFQTQRVIAENGGATVADSGPQAVIFPGDSSVEPVGNVGGLRYLWYPTLQVSGMPMGNFAVQLGQHGTGHTP